MNSDDFEVAFEERRNREIALQSMAMFCQGRPVTFQDGLECADAFLEWLKK